MDGLGKGEGVQRGWDLHSCYGGVNGLEEEKRTQARQ